MRDYLISVIWVSLIIGLVELISPRMEGSGKYIKYIGGICVLCVIASPITNIIKSSEDFSGDLKQELLDGQESDMRDEYEKIFEQYLEDFSVEQLEETIGDILVKKYDIPKEESRIAIYTKVENGELVLEKTAIFLSGGSVFKNPYKIEEYFADLLGCPCEVAIE